MSKQSYENFDLQFDKISSYTYIDKTHYPHMYTKIVLKGSLTVWALNAYFSDSQNAAFERLV